MTVLGTIAEDSSVSAFHGLRKSAEPPYRGHSSTGLVLIMTILPRFLLFATIVVGLSRSVTGTACVAARTPAAQEY